MFTEVQFEHNRASLLLSNLTAYMPEYKPGLDIPLLQFLQQTPSIFPLEFPLKEQISKTILGFLNYRICNGDPHFYDILFGRQESNKIRTNVCGYVFKNGEPVYRCYDCGVDSTCVMCSDCFKSGQHSDHDFRLNYSSGTGGCCDCGDAEAWKVPISCTYHQPTSQPEGQKLPQQLINSIHTTLATVLEMILQTFEGIPLDEGISPLTVANILDSDDGLQQYSVLVWNDEKHSFNEMINVLQTTVGYDRSVGYDCVCRIDSHGRDVIQSNSSLEQLTQTAVIISRIGIKTSIRASKDIFREYVATILLEWMVNLIRSPRTQAVSNGGYYESVTLRIQDILCDELKSQFLYDTVPSSLPRLRIDCFLKMSHFMWKKPIHLILQIIVSTFLVLNDDSKKWLDDKPYSLTMLSLSVQLFTTPSVVNNVIKTTDILTTCLNIIRATFYQITNPGMYLLKKFDDAVLLASKNFKPIYTPLKLMGQLYPVKFDEYLLNFQYLVNSWKRSGEFDIFQVNLGKNEPICAFLELLKLLQSCDSQKRALIVHVDFEPDDWSFFFQVSERIIHGAILPLSDCYFMENNHLCSSAILHLISETMDSLFTWSLHDHWENLKSIDKGAKRQSSTGFHSIGLYNKYSIPDRRVGFQFMSFHHPLHWFLSSLLVHIPKMKNFDAFQHLESEIFYFDAQKIDSTSRNSKIINIQDLEGNLTHRERLLLVFDYPMQALAFVAQVKSGLWVRNGILLHRQAVLFKDKILRDCYDLNIFLLQYGCIVFGGDLFFTSLIDRFGVFEWFDMDKENEVISFDEEKVPSLIQDLVHLIIVILSERSFLGAEAPLDRIRREVLHQLAARPGGISYSRLSEKLSPVFISAGMGDGNLSPFDAILGELAEFKAPETFNTHGLYFLKEKYYEEVSAWYWHYTRNQRDEVEDLLRKKYRHSDSEVLALNLPRLVNLPSVGSLVRFNDIIATETFFALILIGIWKSCRKVFLPDNFKKFDDGLFSHFLQLLLIAIVITESLELCKRKIFYEKMYQFKLKANVTKSTSKINLTVVDIILGLIDRASLLEIKEYSSKLRYIARKTEEMGNQDLKMHIAGWRDKSNWTFFNEGISCKKPSKINSANKREVAKARKETILARFAQAQSSFMANYIDEMAEIEDESMDSMEESPENKTSTPWSNCWEFPRGNCIICQEDTSINGEAYGIIGLIQKSTYCRKVDFLDQKNIAQIANSPLTLDRNFEVKNETFLNAEFECNNRIHKNGARITKSGLYGTSCGHIMHFKCLQSYLDTIIQKHESEPFIVHPENLLFKEFLCPFCKSLGNTLFPVIWDSLVENINWNGSTESNSIQYDSELIDYFTKDLKIVFDELSKIVETHSNINNNELTNSSSVIVIDPILENILKGMATNIGIFGNGLSVLEENYSKYVFENITNMQSWQYMTPNQINIAIVTQIFELFANTVASAEIMGRGVSPSESGSSRFPKVGVLENLNAPIINLLRILGETCSSAAVVIHWRNSSYITSYFLEYLQDLIPSLSRKTGPSLHDPLLQTDGFLNLVMISAVLIPQVSREKKEQIFKWIRLMAVFELLRTVISIIEAIHILGISWVSVFMENLNEDDISSYEESIPLLSSLIEYTKSLLGLPISKTTSATDLIVISRICELALLNYQRKCVIFLYVKYGLVPPSDASRFGPNGSNNKFTDLNEKNELTRLSEYLGLPSFKGLLEFSNEPFVMAIISHWCIKLRDSDPNYWENLASVGLNKFAVQKILIDQPQILTLINLPHNLAQLINGALSNSCHNCGKIPQDPALCLFCGTLLCSQSVCCTDGGRGECNLHMDRKCSLLLLCRGLGTFMNPPYLDIHGEADPGMVRGKPQFLYLKRYEEIKKLWLSQGIPSFIARRFEHLSDHGGWRTL